MLLVFLEFLDVMEMLKEQLIVSELNWELILVSLHLLNHTLGVFNLAIYNVINIFLSILGEWDSHFEILNFACRFTYKSKNFNPQVILTYITDALPVLVFIKVNILFIFLSVMKHLQTSC